MMPSLRFKGITIFSALSRTTTLCVGKVLELIIDKTLTSQDDTAHASYFFLLARALIHEASKMASPFFTGYRIKIENTYISS